MKRKKEETPIIEWSHPLEAEKAGVEVMDLIISPPEAVLPALCERLGIERLEACKADIRLDREKGNLVIYVSGKVTARVHQKCVITLEPVISEISEDFEAWFSDPEQAVSLHKARQIKEAEKYNVETPMMEEQEDPEPITDGKIDLGEVVTQFLSLAIDPYPHAPGAKGDESAAPKEISVIPEERRNPFAALKDWKSGSKNEDNS